MRYVSYRAEQVVRRAALQMKSIQSNAWRNLFGLWDGGEKKVFFVLHFPFTYTDGSRLYYLPS